MRTGVVWSRNGSVWLTDVAGEKTSSVDLPLSLPGWPRPRVRMPPTMLRSNGLGAEDSPFLPSGDMIGGCPAEKLPTGFMNGTL